MTSYIAFPERLKLKVKRRIKKLYRFYKFNFITPWVAYRAIKKVKKDGSKGLFLDCGSNIGQGFNFFRSHFIQEFFDYELFEPNPNCIPFLQKIKSNLDFNIIIHPYALSDHDGVAKFYGLSEPSSGGLLSQGGSVLPEHNSATYTSDNAKAIEVITLDFAKFLKNKLNKYTTIVIKMDIEGGEYLVLEHLLSEGLFPKVHSIFCEFHSQYMSEEESIAYRAKELKIKKEIRKTGCIFNLWI